MALGSVIYAHIVKCEIMFEILPYFLYLFIYLFFLLPFLWKKGSDHHTHTPLAPFPNMNWLLPTRYVKCTFHKMCVFDQCSSIYWHQWNTDLINSSQQQCISQSIAEDGNFDDRQSGPRVRILYSVPKYWLCCSAVYFVRCVV